MSGLEDADDRLIEAVRAGQAASPADALAAMLAAWRDEMFAAWRDLAILVDEPPPPNAAAGLEALLLGSGERRSSGGGTHIGLVVPADPAAQAYTVEWTGDTELLPILRREIGCEYVDSFRVQHPRADLTVWVDDTGLLADEIVHNDRAIALARAFGYPVPDVAGNAFLTGPPDPEGDMTGLPEPLVGMLLNLLPPATQGGG